MFIRLRIDWQERVLAYGPALLVLGGTATLCGLAARVNDLFVKGLGVGLALGLSSLVIDDFIDGNPLLNPGDKTYRTAWYAKAAVFPAFLIAVRSLSATDVDKVAFWNGLLAGVVFGHGAAVTSLTNLPLARPKLPEKKTSAV